MNTEPVPQSFAEVMRSCAGQERCEGEWRGVNFRLYRDRSAVFEIASTSTTWAFDCRVDAMDDSHSCTLTGRTGSYSKYRPYLMVLWGDNWFGPAVSVAHGEEGYPNSEEMLRVDQSPAFSVDEDNLFTGQRANAILNQLKRGGLARLRFYDWPYNESHDSSVDLDGFTVVWEAVTELRKQVSK